MDEVEYDGSSFVIGSYPSAVTLAKILNKPGNYNIARSIKRFLSRYNETCNEICNSDIGRKTHLLIILRNDALSNIRARNYPQEVEEFTCCAIVGKYREAIRFLEGLPSNVKLKGEEIPDFLWRNNFGD